ncbi:unnamed protein product [Ectocarpus sp. CCAP 1310/34]|nr:unnamed protein product [Ectocarpus sp. CCAP 1310/34]
MRHAHAPLLLYVVDLPGEVAMFVDEATEVPELCRLSVFLSRGFDGQWWRRGGL